MKQYPGYTLVKHEDCPEQHGTLTVLTHFRTMQQTSEWSCGVTAALMVLNWYGKLGDWNEESLAALRHSLDGTELEEIVRFACASAGLSTEKPGGISSVPAFEDVCARAGL